MQFITLYCLNVAYLLQVSSEEADENCRNYHKAGIIKNDAVFSQLLHKTDISIGR